MVNKILLPFDFSVCAEHALRAALFIASKSKAEIVILHISEIVGTAQITVRDGNLSAENINPETKDDVLLAAEAIADNVRKMVDRYGFPESTWQTQIENGNIAAKIIEVCERLNCDFIVMGTQGDADYENMVIGSNTQKVTRNAPCPMLMVRNFKEENFFKHIVLALDFETAGKQAVAFVTKFQKLMKAKLFLMYINTPLYFITEREAKHRFEKFVRVHHLENVETHLYCDLHEDEGIVHCAQDLHANMIALVTNKRKGLSRLLSGSVSEDVITESLMPVLVLPSDYKFEQEE